MCHHLHQTPPAKAVLTTPSLLAILNYMGKTIWFASSNSHKKAEMERLLPGTIIRLPKEAGLDFDPVEDGESFIDNALLKARALYELVKAPVLADDSGLCVDALSGRPGIHTARYGCEDGRKLTSQEQYTLLLKEMEGVQDRSARFVSACVLMLSPSRIHIIQESVEGRIATAPAGLHGFGYDPIFLVGGGGRSMAQLSDEEKDEVSHRGRAMRRIGLLLKEEE